MATFVGSTHKGEDLVKEYSCGACESKNIIQSADVFCEPCLKCFCKNCLHYHDQIFVNHLTYGRGETNKWPPAKTMVELFLKCDSHNKKLKLFCQDHSQLCCSDCVLLNHRQCTNLALISELDKRLSVDMKQMSNKIQTILAELNKCKKTQEGTILSVEGSYSERLQEITEMRKKLNAALDKLENATLKELEEIRTKLQTALKKDVDNCSRLKDELHRLGEAVKGIGDQSKTEIEFIAGRKCLDKIQESVSYLKENPVKVQTSTIFKANTEILQYLSKQSGLGRTVDSKQSPKKVMNPDQVLTLKRTFEYNVKILSDKRQTCYILGICSLPSGQTIIADYNNKRLKMLDKDYNVSSHCDLDCYPQDIFQITQNMVAVTDNNKVQFIPVENGKLVSGHAGRSMFELRHAALGISCHNRELYITSGTALYLYTWSMNVIKMLYEDTGGGITVYKCALSPDGDWIYVTNFSQHTLTTLATDGTVISTFTDPELQGPKAVHVTPTGQLLVCTFNSHTVIQVDHEERKKIATLASQKEGVSYPVSVCYNTNSHQIIVGAYASNNISVMDLQ
ncbi:uncharacterized protein LOC127848532 [Dreissena polymorpha]|uniref:B box-type domain-containing protein n=1 Tax=Dreissena polymorpha TaxID=45954 RepID=A0A9D4DKN8_DREPO|nr:uncharacterized protein LOC127848532 [Dreissena polymorpha]KAH3750080.1 hypothetical protein DPMN_184596 [Dreissena polymorpha]